MKGELEMVQKRGGPSTGQRGIKTEESKTAKDFGKTLRANEIKGEQTSYGQTIRNVKKDAGRRDTGLHCAERTSGPFSALINSCWGTPSVLFFRPLTEGVSAFWGFSCLQRWDWFVLVEPLFFDGRPGLAFD